MDLRRRPAGERFISFGSEGRIQGVVDEVFDSLGIRRRIVGRVFNSATACSLIAQGLGIAIVDPFSAADFLGRGIVVRPFRPVVSYHFKLLYPRSRERSKLLNAFVPVLKASARRWAALAPAPAASSDGPSGPATGQPVPAVAAQVGFLADQRRLGDLAGFRPRQRRRPVFEVARYLEDGELALAVGDDPVRGRSAAVRPGCSTR